MDIQDLKQGPQAGNRYLSGGVLDQAGNFLFSHPLPSRESVEVSRTFSDLMFLFSELLSIRTDAGRGVTAKVLVAQHLCRRMHIFRWTMDRRTTHERRGGAERMGGWSHEVVGEFC